MVYPALNIRPPNIAGAYQAGIEARTAQTRNRLLNYKMDRENKLAGLRSKMFSGRRNGLAQETIDATEDPFGTDMVGQAPDSVMPQATSGSDLDQDAFREYMAIDPEGGKQLIDALDKLDARTLAETKQKNALGAKMMIQLESLPPDQRPMAYVQMKEHARSQGLNVANLPPQYDPNKLETALMRAVSVDKYIELKQKQKLTKKDLVQVRTAKGVQYVPADQAVGMAPVRKPSALDEKISVLRQTGVPEDVAKGIAAGRYAQDRHPVTGVLQIVDKATGEVIYPKKAATSQAEDEETGEQRPSYTLWGITQPGEVTGPEAAIGEAYGRVAPWFGLEGAPRTTAARTAFRTETNQLIRALSINPRFPVGEIERIRNEVNIKPAFFDSTTALKQRMRSVARSLRRRMGDEVKAANDASLPGDVRQSAARAARDLSNFLEVLGVPDREQSGTSDEDRALIEKYLK